MAILTSGEQVGGIEILRAFFDSASTDTSSNTAAYQQLYRSLLEFDEQATGDSSLKLLLSAIRMQQSASAYLKEYPEKASVVGPVIDGIEDWMNDELVDIPKEINLVINRQPDEMQLEQLLSWGLNDDYTFVLWADSRAVLSDFLNGYYLRQLSNALKNATAPFQFKDNLTEQYIRSQDNGIRAISKMMADGSSFDDAVTDYMTGTLQIPESDINDYLRDNRFPYTRLQQRLQRQGVRVITLDVAMLWTENAELEPFYQQLLMLGKSDLAAHVLRAEILYQRGGILLSDGVIPAVNREPFREIDLSGLPMDTVDAALTQAVTEQLQSHFPAWNRQFSAPGHNGYIDFIGRLEQLEPGIAGQLRGAVTDKGIRDLLRPIGEVQALPDTALVFQHLNRVSDRVLAAPFHTEFAAQFRQRILERFRFIQENGLDQLLNASEQKSQGSRLLNVLVERQL